MESNNSNFGGSPEKRQVFNKSLEDTLRTVVDCYNEGNSFYKLHRFDEAIKCYDKCLEINPYHAETWFMKATANEQLGKLKDAEFAYRRFIEVAPPSKFGEYIKIVNKRLQEIEGS